MKISIEGNISGGKSTLIKKISHTTGVPVFLEPVESWSECLELFYKDPSRWSLAANLNILCSFAQWKNNGFLAVYERSPCACRHVFTQLQADEGQMHPFELEVFDKVYGEVSWKPDVIIYINTDPNVCMERMKSRARQCEASVSLSYLQKIDHKYKKMLEMFKNNTAIYEIDGNQKEEGIFKDAMSILKAYCG